MNVGFVRLFLHCFKPFELLYSGHQRLTNRFNAAHERVIQYLIQNDSRKSLCMQYIKLHEVNVTWFLKI